jgi:hypothetical protein
MDRNVATLALWLEPRSSQLMINNRLSGPYPRRSTKLGLSISLLQRSWPNAIAAKTAVEIEIVTRG